MLLRTLRIALLTDPLAALIILLMGITSTAVALFDRAGNVQHRVAAFWARLLLFSSGVRVDTHGMENIPEHGGAVFVANHLSMMDVPVLMAHLPASFRFLAKKSLFQVPFIGWHLRLARHIGVDRNDTRAAAKAAGKARWLLQEGISVMVFAEGSRSEGELQSFKAGAAHIAIKAGAPLMPVGISGTQALLPRGSLHIRPGKACVRVGEPIVTEGLTARDQPRLTELLRSRVSGLIAECEPETA